MPERTGENRGKRNRKGALAGGNNVFNGANAKYLFGSPEEVANRINTGYPSDKNPTTHPPSFTQIPPSISGESANDPRFKHRSGDIKFSGGI